MPRLFLQIMPGYSGHALYSDTENPVEYKVIPESTYATLKIDVGGVIYEVDESLVEKAEKGGYIAFDHPCTSADMMWKSKIKKLKTSNQTTIQPGVATVNWDHVKIEAEELDDFEFPDEVFETLKFNHPIDQFFSFEGGIPKASQIVFPGEKGTGKTSNAIQFALMLKKANPHLRILFGSFEMNPINMKSTVAKHYPAMGNQFKIFFPHKYIIEGNIPAAIAFEKLLEEGWDIVITDSLKEYFQLLSSDLGLTGAAAESYYLRLMDQHNYAHNERKLWTSFWNIQQLTKSGAVAGTERLMHMVHASFKFERDEKNRKLTRIVSDKNRFGISEIPMYYKKTNNGMEYDTAKFEQYRYIAETMDVDFGNGDQDFASFFDEASNEVAKNELEKMSS